MNKKELHAHTQIKIVWWKKSCLCTEYSQCIWNVCCARTVVSCIDRHPKIQLFSFTVCWFPSSYLLVHSFNSVLFELLVLLMLSTRPCHLQHDQSHQKHSHSTHGPHARALLLSLSVSRFHNLDGSNRSEKGKEQVCVHTKSVCVRVCSVAFQARKEKSIFNHTRTHNTVI